MKITPRAVLSVLLALTFIWPGLDKFNQPGYWVMWLPSLFDPLRPGYGESLVYFIAVFEIVVGVALLVPALQRYAAMTGSVFLALILVTSGINSVTFRDLGLLGATIYLAATGPSMRLALPRLRLSRSLVAPALALLAFLGVSLIPFSVNIPVSSSGSNIVDGNQQVVAFLAPTDGQSVPVGDVQLKFRILFDAKKMGLNHVHVKLDGKVVDAIYLSGVSREMTTRVRILQPGTHTVTISFGYLDHTEPSSLSATLRFAVAG